MRLTNTTNRYGMVAIFFHWLMAVLIIGMLTLGLYMTTLPIGLEKLKFYGWHKEFGLLILWLAILRFAWRLTNSLPTLNIPLYEKIIARIVHLIFYFFMIAMPITGWIISSAANVPVSFFGIFTMPNIVSADKNTMMLFAEIHEFLAYSFIAIILLHIAAALKHYYIDKDDILQRMIS